MSEIVGSMSSGSTFAVSLGILFVVIVLGILEIKFWGLIDTAIPILRNSEGLDPPRKERRPSDDILAKLDELSAVVRDLKAKCDSAPQTQPAPGTNPPPQNPKTS